VLIPFSAAKAKVWDGAWQSSMGHEDNGIEGDGTFLFPDEPVE
jgi:hypothetical protein